MPSAKAGENVGILIRNVKLSKINKGMILCAENSLKYTNCYRVKIYFLTAAEGGRKRPVQTGYIQQLFSNTWNITCRLDLDPDTKMLMPGDHATVTMTLLRKMAMTMGQGFTIRENHVMVATGIIADFKKNVEVKKNNLGLR